jgi:hypothetical protein
MQKEIYKYFEPKYLKGFITVESCMYFYSKKNVRYLKEDDLDNDVIGFAFEPYQGEEYCEFSDSVYREYVNSKIKHQTPEIPDVSLVWKNAGHVWTPFWKVGCNYWETSIYTEAKAWELSKTLVNCHYCYNCSFCYNCYHCYDCHFCDDCEKCFTIKHSNACNESGNSHHSESLESCDKVEFTESAYYCQLIAFSTDVQECNDVTFSRDLETGTKNVHYDNYYASLGIDEDN